MKTEKGNIYLCKVMFFLQVVDFLNSLYNLFDDAIDK